jgi:hypothetical protein
VKEGIREVRGVEEVGRAIEGVWEVRGVNEVGRAIEGVIKGAWEDVREGVGRARAVGGIWEDAREEEKEGV